MKRFLLLLTMLIAGAHIDGCEDGGINQRAHAAWVEYQPGWYVKSNGFSNDGWYYRKVPTLINAGYGTCGCYNYCAPTYSYEYVQAARIADFAADGDYATGYGTTTTKISYTKNWKTDLVGALEKNKDSELFIQAVRESGLKANPAYGGGAGPLYAMPNYAGGLYSTTGSASYSTGYAVQGSTVAGIAAYAAQALPDPALALHEYQRDTTQIAATGMALQNNIAGLIGAQQQNYKELAIIEASGKTAVALALAATTAQSQTSTTVTPVQPQPPIPGPPPLTGPPPALPTPDQSLPRAVLPAIRGGLLVEQNCLACHGAATKNALNLTRVSGMSAEDRAKLAGLALRRMTKDEPGKPRMPKDHPALPEAQVNLIAEWIANGRE